MQTLADASGVVLPTAPLMQAVAGAIQAVAARPDELTQAAQTLALSVLQQVAALLLAPLLSNATALSVVAALSSVAQAVVLPPPDISATDLSDFNDTIAWRRRGLLQAPSRPGSFSRSPFDVPAPGPAVPEFAQAMAIATALCDSLAVGLSLPDDPALTATSPALQLSVQLASTGPDSPLSEASFSAPGSASAVFPLPAGAYAALAFNSTSAVVVQYISSSFDPFATSLDDAGVARLRFVRPFGQPDGGREVVLANISQPVTFSLSASTPREGSVSLAPACSFWNETMQRYRCAWA